MLVIDDNKLKLLKMKEKLLEVSNSNRDTLLKEYKELAITIDKEIYSRIVEMIKNTDYTSLPLSEALTFLIQVEEEYNGFYELICAHKIICEKYNDNYQLPFEDNILIDNIKDRISTVEGYLTSIKNISDNNREIESLNIELVNEQKKKDNISLKFKQFEEELKNNFLYAEGRTISQDGEIKYTSTIKEYKDAGLELEKLLNDEEYLTKELDKAKLNNKSLKEKQMAALICYQNMPDANTRELYNTSNIEYNKSEYINLLIQIAKLLSVEFNEYYEVRQKRDEIKKLTNERYQYLNERFLADPFTRIKIDNQLEIIDKFKENTDKIEHIKERINALVSHSEELEAKEKELATHINDDFKIMKESTSNQKEGLKNIYNTYKDMASPNQVIDIKDYDKDFKIDRVKEKTDGVISRVYGMLKQEDRVETTEVVPNLVIEESTFTDDTDKSEIFLNDITPDSSIEPVEFSEEKTEDIFTDSPPAQVSDNNAISNDLFEDIEPFESTPLFMDRSESTEEKKEKPSLILNLNNQEELPKNDISESIMPDTFWVTQEEEKNEEDEPISFDEQINALINEEQPKKRVLSA